MSTSAGQIEESLKQLKGRRIAAADSSLTCFAVKFEDGSAVLFEALGDAGDCFVGARVMGSSELPVVSEAVCSVDWGWIGGSAIDSTAFSGNQVSLTLSPAGPLSVSALLWQGKPFLAFHPFRPAR